MKELLTLLLMFFSLVDAHATLKEVTANEKARLNIELSSQGANRIMVKRDRILKVIGNDDDYFIEGDLLRGHIFITPKVELDKKIPLTLMTEKGLIQDITFRVGDVEPVSMLISTKTQVKPVKTNNITTQEFQVVKAIQDVTSGNTSGYVVRKLEDKYYNHSAKGLPVKILSVKEYSNKTFKVKVLQYQKKDDVQFNIRELSQVYPKSLAITEHGNQIIMVERV